MSETKSTESVRVQTPPARLYSTLIGVVERADYDGNSVGQVLARAVGHSEEHRRLWYKAHGELVDLLLEATDYVERNMGGFADSPHQKTLAGISRGLVDLPMHENWGAHRPRLADLVVVALPFVVHSTDPDPSPVTVPRSDISAILEMAETLIVQVRDSDLPKEIRQEILVAVHELRDRMLRFQIFGREGVKRAAANLVGALTVNESVIRSKADIVKQSADIMTKVADVFLKYYAIGTLGHAWLRQIGAG